MRAPVLQEQEIDLLGRVGHRVKAIGQLGREFGIVLQDKRGLVSGVQQGAVGFEVR